MSTLESVEKRSVAIYPNGKGSVVSFYFKDGSDVHCEFTEGEKKERTIATLQGVLRLLIGETSP